MNLAEQLERTLHEKVPFIETKLSRPRNPDGEWWIDATLRPGSGSEKTWIVIQWSEKLGFGVSLVDEADVGYGEGPNEVFSTSEAALDRIVKLFEPTLLQRYLANGTIT